MKTIIFTLLFGFSFFLKAQEATFFGAELPNDSITHQLKKLQKAISDENHNSVDSLKNLLSSKNLSQSGNQKAIFEYLEGLYYAKNAFYDRAMLKYSNCIKLANQSKNKNLELKARVGVASMIYYLDDIKTSTAEFEKVLNYCEKEDWLLKASLHGNLAATYFEYAWGFTNKNQSPDSLHKISQYHFKEAIQLLEKHKHSEELSRLYAIYSRSLIQDKNYVEAHSFLEKADSVCKLTKNEYSYHFNQIKWSDYYKPQKRYLQSRNHLKTAYNFYKKVNELNMEHYVTKELAVNFAYTNTFDSAYHYAILLDELAKRMNLEKMGKRMSYYQVELDVYDKENKIIEQDAQLKVEKFEKKLAKAEANRWIVGGISAVAILLLIGILVFQNLRQKTKTDKANLIIEERERAFQEVLEGQENERRRIAQELHDGIGQQLSGIKMALQNLMDASKSQTDFIEKNIPPILNLVSSSAADVRLLAHQMQPQVLVEKGLKAALADLAQITHQTTKIKFGLEYKIDVAKLNEQYELAIYRSLQELINNTIKHANASKIEIYIYENKTHLLIAYSDNGTGIQEKSKGTGLGLSGIKNRIESLNGSFSYDDSQNFGFSSIFKLPIL